MKTTDIYDSTDLASTYDKSRKLPKETLKLWLDTISCNIPQDSIGSIIDIGCGTGRFAKALSKHFSAKVYGIDPSREMLAMARKAISSPAIHFLRGTGEDIPVNSGIADLVFLSMVYHHIQDKNKAISEFKRVLKPNGSLCIRTATIECMESYLWFHFFPAAREIDLKRMPSRKAMIGFFSGKGFKLKDHTVVKQLFAKNHRDYFEKISLRGISTLRVISDDEFNSGLMDLKNHCSGLKTKEAIFEDIDLFTFVLV